jgi:hypothetical protein
LILGFLHQQGLSCRVPQAHMPVSPDSSASDASHKEGSTAKESLGGAILQAIGRLEESPGWGPQTYRIRCSILGPFAQRWIKFYHPDPLSRNIVDLYCRGLQFTLTSKSLWLSPYKIRIPR